MKRRTLTSSLFCLGAVLTLGGAAVVVAQQSPPQPIDTAKPAAPTGLGALTGRPDAPAVQPDAAEAGRAQGDVAGNLLGELYENRAAGISLRPPAGSRTVRKMGGDEVVEFIDEERRWTLKVMLLTTLEPIALTRSTGVDGRETDGLMEIVKVRVSRALPDGATAERRFLREDVVNVEDGIPSADPRQRVPNVGMLALRYTKGLERLLGQQAIIQANERMYYLVTLISPGKPIPIKDGAAAPVAIAPKPAGESDEPAESLENADPKERQAVEAFSQIIDSIKLLDRSKLKQEQDERLYKTRALFVNLTPEKLKASVVPQQWYRLIRKGKDIGYVYTIEELANGIPQPNEIRRAGGVGGVGVAAGEDGVLVGTRSRLVVEDEKTKVETQIDAESWMFVTMNREHEDWSSLIVTTDRKTGKKDHVTEVGSSDREQGAVLDRAGLERGERGDRLDPNQPPVRMRQDYFLNVTHVARGGNAEPVNRSLVPWYLPQAMSKMLPRLLPYKQPKGYLFAQYVGDSREVMNRYVDVEQLQKVTLAGHVMRAIPIRDRITLDGPVTTHYLSESGVYLGSDSTESDVAVIPTDEKTLKELWKDADLSRPNDANLSASAAGAPRTPRSNAESPDFHLSPDGARPRRAAPAPR